MRPANPDQQMTTPVEGFQESLPDIARDPALILALAQQVLGMSATFYAHMDAQQMTLLRTLRAPDDPAAPPIQDGLVAPLVDTYCQFVYRSGKPLVVSDAAHTAPFASLTATRDLGIGSYVGVPLVTKDGTIIGTLCGLDEHPRTLTAEQVATLRLLGQALMAGIEHDALLRELEQQRSLALLALRDALTGLPNRRAFDDALAATIATAAAAGTALALLFIDVDHFKQVNDRFGHEIGDATLRFVAARLSHRLGEGETLFRFGGEELVALLPASDAEAALTRAERLRTTLHLSLSPGERALDGLPLLLPPALRVTASIGVALYPADAASGPELVRRADAAMYHAKRLGRDRVCHARIVRHDTPTPNTRLYALGQAVPDSLADGLVAALGAHDPSTGAHSDRLTDLTERVMHTLSGNTDETRLAGVAARLHDIGKVGVAATILAKTAPLDQEEWGIVRQHPSIGARILQECGGALAAVAHVVGAHHERWDGSGYPHGLRGTAIPLGARVIAVVDAFDAMTSDRPYRAALPLREAIAELKRGAGTQFDPQVVAAFLDEMGLADAPDAQAA